MVQEEKRGKERSELPNVSLEAPVETLSQPERERVAETRQDQENRVAQERQLPKKSHEGPLTSPASVQHTTQEKDQITKDLEDLLAADLTDVFLGMSPEKRTAFKLAGEQAAQKIKAMMEKGTVKAKTILDIIRAWLKLVPGVNKFFLDQEAKIKTDKILEYQKTMQREQDPRL